MATLKHINSKNADYGAAEQYLLFEHDEFTMKPVLDENGRLIKPNTREKQPPPNSDAPHPAPDIVIKPPTKKIPMPRNIPTP